MRPSAEVANGLLIDYKANTFTPSPIAHQEQTRARAIAIAKGEYKPKPGEPTIWFTSMRSVAEVLSDENRALLKVIRESNPDSIAVLAKATGRQPGNLSRTP